MISVNIVGYHENNIRQSLMVHKDDEISRFFATHWRLKTFISDNPDESAIQLYIRAIYTVFGAIWRYCDCNYNEIEKSEIRSIYLTSRKHVSS